MSVALPHDRDLTVLLTLKDRVPFTFRWMEYANAIRLPFKVLIADGGADESVRMALSDHARFPCADYEYIRYPYDATYADYHAKTHEALKRIQTPFVALADNDDFLLVDGVRQAVEFLRTHSDYASCGGQIAIFWVTPFAGQDSDVLYGRDVEWKSSLDVHSVTAETARERIRSQSLRATYPIHYHVRRTAELTEQFRMVRELKLTDLFLVEYLLWFLIAVAGKTKQLETPYLARQWNSPGSSGVAHAEAFGDWLGRMLTPSWSDDFAKFVDVTGTALAARDGMSQDEARRWIIDSYRMLVAPALLEDVLKEPTTTASMSIVVGVVRRLLQLPLEHPMRRLARALYRRARWISPDVVHGTQLHSRRVPHAEESFKPIRQFLTPGSG